MLKTTEEGLEVYKQAVKGFLEKCRLIDTRERADRNAREVDYMGSLDWPKADWEWKQATEQQMLGMETALGLSVEEVAKIVKSVKDDLFGTAP